VPETLLDPVYKQPSERWKRAIEYYGRLPPGTATLSSAVLTAVDTEDESDVSTTLIDQTTKAISGTQLSFVLMAGDDTHDYKVTVKMTLSDNQVLEDDFMVYVREL
jgi:hypothetical protein